MGPRPIDGGASNPATARLVGADLAQMDKAFKGGLSSLPAAGAASAHQAPEIETGLSRRIFQATGRPLARPTIVYKDADGLIRVVRGAVGPELFARIANDAR